VTATAQPRGVCPLCGKRIVIRPNGALRQHRLKKMSWYAAPECDGSGQPPKPEPIP
jgi:hypothetical protein